MAISKRDEGSKVNATINVTPMVDVMLVLLIIFMVITPMLQKGASVDMAQANNPVAMQDADKEDAILIAITRSGDIFLGSEKTRLDDLTNKVKDKLDRKSGGDKRAFVKADARAKYGDVVSVVDNVRSAGVDELGLLTEQKHGAPPPPPPTKNDQNKPPATPGQ